MNWLIKLLIILQGKMNTPKSFGWFHLLWIGFVIISIIFLYTRRNNHNEKQLKIILGIYSIPALLLEILKQIIWTFNYDSITNIINWDYQWYAFPFQLCTTPIFVCLICLFLKKNKVRDALLSYLSFVTIWGSFMTIILPDSCFTSDILVNIHTMWLHLGSFIVSVYLLISKEVELKPSNLINAIVVFLSFVGIAMYLNYVIYNLGILNGETFNMFYISPYFISHLPVFSTIQQNVPYLLYLLFYIFVISLGASLIYFVVKLIKKYNDNWS